MMTEIFQPRWLDPPSLLGAMVGSALDPFLIAVALVAALGVKRPLLGLAVASVAYPVFMGFMIGAMDTVEPGNNQLDLYIPRFLAVWTIGGIALGVRRLKRGASAKPASGPET